MKAHGDVDARVHIYTATAQGSGRKLVLRSAAFASGKTHGIHFKGAEG